MFDRGSDKGRIVVEMLPASAAVAVDPSLPEPDLSGLGDIRQPPTKRWGAAVFLGAEGLIDAFLLLTGCQVIA